ncbi:MAG: hypothetical protein U9Q40_02900 [Campylobacterota bacterium]|nr:hypothetical protein [Campylobacterota bacterium]
MPNAQKEASLTIENKDKQHNKTLDTKTVQNKEQKEILDTNDSSMAINVTSDGNSLNNNEPLKLAPSFDFIKNMQHSSTPYYNSESMAKQVVKTKKQEPKQDIKKQVIEEIVQDLTVDKTPTVKQEEIQKVTIKRRNITDDIKHIIKRFKKNNNPALSLFVAKKYYELGDYHKAYNYALITNQINSDIDASWIVFSKSLVKMNEKEMAIKTLKEYIESSHSSSAQILLDEIVSGKFK